MSSTDTSKVTEHSERNVIATTQKSSEESLTTLMTGAADSIAVTLNTRLDLDLLKPKNNTILPEKNKILPVIEAIINKTRQKDQDYDYDYNEPSLPPSLPNLRWVQKQSFCFLENIVVIILNVNTTNSKIMIGDFLKSRKES